MKCLRDALNNNGAVLYVLWITFSAYCAICIVATINSMMANNRHLMECIEYMHRINTFNKDV